MDSLRLKEAETSDKTDMSPKYGIAFNRWVVIDDKISYMRWLESYIVRVHSPRCHLRRKNPVYQFAKDPDTKQLMVRVVLDRPCDCSMTTADFRRGGGGSTSFMELKRYQSGTYKPVWTTEISSGGEIFAHLFSGEIVNFEWINMTYPEKISIDSLGFDYNPNTYTGLIPKKESDEYSTVVYWYSEKDDPHLRRRFSTIMG